MDFIASISTLRSLHLDRTGLTSKGLARLSPLKSSLRFLNIRCNPDVDDDAIESIALFKLDFLFAIGTSITMYGLSRLAERLDDDRRRMGICLPEACDVWFFDIYSHAVNDVVAQWDALLKRVFEIVPEEEAFSWDAETDGITGEFL
ncbi:hypothetical protein CALCODRAFT_483044 [Calocera cornea HHB12733]|uniref:RNI-like protein n=1 Tax=Calocera cornea HHB12733 TaxID=1353952 RepID=A0A165G4H8_9BASI|nr:hypothetical protein CALCODRAFT_483044 [Calocera cornea HHB12733]